MNFDKSKVKVLVADKQQAKQFKAILVGLGEPISKYYWLDSFGPSQTDLIYNSDNLWAVGCNQVNREIISIKELIQGLSVKEEPKRKFVIKSEDGVDLCEWDKVVYVWKHNSSWEVLNTYTIGIEVNRDDLNRKNKDKIFSNPEAALKWIEEQNKPKQATVQLGMEKAVLSHDNGISFYRSNQDASFFSITHGELEEIYTAYKSLQS